MEAEAGHRYLLIGDMKFTSLIKHTQADHHGILAASLLKRRQGRRLPNSALRMCKITCYGHKLDSIRNGLA